MVGTGLLQLPKGAAQSGWIGVGMLGVMGVMATYTARIIPLSLDIIRKRRPLLDDPNTAPAQTYGDIGEAAFGPRGRWFVTAQQHIAQVRAPPAPPASATRTVPTPDGRSRAQTMVACIQHLLAAFTLHELLEGSLPWLSYPVMVLVISIVLWFHCFLKTLGDVAVLSYFNISISVALLLVVIYEALSHPPAEPAHTTLLVPNALSVGYAFASFGFSYGIHPVLPALYHSMRKPQQYGPMIYTTFALIMGAFYMPMVAVGYATCAARSNPSSAAAVQPCVMVRDAATGTATRSRRPSTRRRRSSTRWP